MRNCRFESQLPASLPVEFSSTEIRPLAGPSAVSDHYSDCDERGQEQQPPTQSYGAFAGQQHSSGREVPPCGGGRTPRAQFKVKRGALRAALKSSERRQVQVVVLWGAERFEVLADGHLSESVRAITCDATDRDQVQQPPSETCPAWPCSPSTAAPALVRERSVNRVDIRFTGAAVAGSPEVWPRTPVPRPAHSASSGVSGAAASGASWACCSGCCSICCSAYWA